MKRTNEMNAVITGSAPKRTIESRELYLCMTNESRLAYIYNGICAALAKKYRKGEYIADRAIDAFYPLACEASDLYYKDYGYRFTPVDRFRACVEMVEGFDPEEYI